MGGFSIYSMHTPPPDRGGMFSDAKARKRCLSNKNMKNLAPPDKAWISIQTFKL